MASLSAVSPVPIDGEHHEFWLWRPRVQLALSIGAGVLLTAGVFGEKLIHLDAARSLYWLSLLIGLAYGVRAAGIALLERRLDIDVLMVVGALMAAGVGHAEEGALLLVLFTFAGALEQLALARTKREIRSLQGVIPDRAIVLRGGEWVEVAPDQVRVGEQVRVRPGDRVPVDAEILEGQSRVDESTLTGESVPRDVAPGDAIFAGTINGEAVLLARATRLASESSVQRVIELVTEAREQREPLQRLIDRVGEPYTIAVFSASTLVFLVWWLALGRSAQAAAYTAITLLIVASPCALVIATPTATLAAIARGARAGVLFKGGESIDRLSRTGAVCFDKTGTLTKGRPAYEALIPLEGSDPDALLAVAGELESDSTHPTAKAIHAAALRAAHADRIGAGVEDIRSIAGRGMAGRWRGEEARVGNLAFVSEIAPEPTSAWLRDTLASVRTQGKLGVAVASGPHAGVIVLQDEVRHGADTLVGALHDLGVRPVRMLTGDDRIVAERIAAQLGLDALDAQLLPEQKVAIVEAMKSDGRSRPGRGVAVVGDGVNDAPALAAADVSIAVGSIGSDAALESADIVLLSEDLSRIPWAIALARATRRTVAVNIILAASVICCMGAFVVVGSLVDYTVKMAVGVLAHEGGTVIVVLNSLRLLWRR